MAASETASYSASSNLQAQIGDITDQLIQLSLFETAKKFNLPLDCAAFSLFSKRRKVKKIETALYSLTIAPDLHEVEIGWQLKVDAIQGRIAKHTVMRRPPEWGFFGFIKDRPFLASDLQSVEDVRAHADISAKRDDKLSLDLKTGLPYSALFLVVFDSLDAFVLDEDVTTMIQRPKSPSIEDITSLKAKLQSLVGSSIDPSTQRISAGRFNEELDEIISRYKVMEEALLQRDISEEQKENSLEELRINYNDEMSALVGRYKK